MDELQEKLIKEAVSQTAGQIYTDLAKPTLKSVGNTISLLPRTIGVWLGKWEKWIINAEKSIELTKQSIEEKLKDIPEEKLSEPEPNIAIPTIQQLSYCYDCEDLRNMYANLLITSMNIDTKAKAHPSFVDIIKQLTPDEAKLLKSISSDTATAYPIINVIGKSKKNNESSFWYILSNFTNIGYEICTYPDNIPSYLENLNRLGLIEITKGECLADETVYDNLKQHARIKEIISEVLSEDSVYDFQKNKFNLTNFGANFIKACVVDSKQINKL